MQRTMLNQQMSIAMAGFLERIHGSIDIPITIISDFQSPEYAKLLSNDVAVVNTLVPGIYVGHITDTALGVATSDTLGLLQISVVDKTGIKVVTREWNHTYSQVMLGDGEITNPPWVKVVTTAALNAVPLATSNPNLIEPTPSAIGHTKMVKGVTYFTATVAELGIPEEIVANQTLVALTSVFVLTVPERKYFYEARVGNDVYVSTVTPASSLVHNWKAAGGTDQTAVEELIRGLIATSIQAVDKTNNTSLMSPKAFSVAFDAALADWVGAAPEALDTIVEIAAAFQNNPDILNVMMGLINGLRTDVDQLKLDVIELAESSGGAIQLVDWDSAPWTTLRNWMSGANMATMPVGSYIGQQAGYLSGLMESTFDLPVHRLNPFGILRVDIIRVPDVINYTPPGGTWFEFTFFNAGLTFRRTCNSSLPNPYQSPWVMVQSSDVSVTQNFDAAKMIAQQLLGNDFGIFNRWAEEVTITDTVPDDGSAKVAFMNFSNSGWKLGVYSDDSGDETIYDDGQVFVMPKMDDNSAVLGWHFKVVTTSGELETNHYGTVATAGKDWTQGTDFVLAVAASNANLTPKWEGVVSFRDPNGKVYANTLKLNPTFTIVQ